MARAIDEDGARPSAFRIGAAVPRVEDLRLVRGRGRYTDDVEAANAAHMAVVRSPHAAARITGVDVVGRARGARRARRPDRHGCRRGRSRIAAHERRAQAPRRPAHGAPAVPPPRPRRGAFRRRRRGDRRRRDARRGLRRRRSRRRRLRGPAERHGGRRGGPRGRAGGVAGRGPGQRLLRVRAGRPRRRRGRLRARRPRHDARFPHDARHRQTRSSRATPSAGTIPSRIATRCMRARRGRTSCKNELAEATLKIPAHKLRVVSPDVGGAFGMKNSPFPEYGLLLWAARRVGRPVRWTATRAESFLSDYHAPRQPLERRTRPRQGRDLPGACESARSPISAPISASTRRIPRPTISAVSPAPTARRISMPRCSACSPTRSRWRRIAAPGARRRPTRSSASSTSPPTSSASTASSSGGATSFRPRRCRSRPASSSPTIPASSRRTWTACWPRRIGPASRAAARKPRRAAACAASASPTPSRSPAGRSRTRTRRAPRSASTATAT